VGTLSFPGIPAADVCDRLAHTARRFECGTRIVRRHSRRSADLPSAQITKLRNVFGGL